MYGNLSQTIVKIPKMFNILSNLSSARCLKTRYREPPLLDTFSQLKNVNSCLNHRYFRVNDHFKENSPYKDLNYNNNKRYISPINKLDPIRSFQYFLFSDYPKYNNTLKRNNSQIQLMPIKKNITILSSKNITKDNLNNNNSNFINIEKKYIENNRYNDGEEKNNISDTNENQNKFENNIEEKNNENNNSYNNSIEEEKNKLNEYINKLINKKPTNLKELRELINMQYSKEEKKKSLFPKINGLHKSMSQDDLFIKTIDKKIESLTMIKPEIKNSIYRRQKNIILKRDYDLLQKIYANHNNNIYPIKMKAKKIALLQ